jgi:hypothetical protein
MTKSGSNLFVVDWAVFGRLPAVATGDPSPLVWLMSVDTFIRSWELDAEQSDRTGRLKFTGQFPEPLVKCFVPPRVSGSLGRAI